MTTEPTPLNVIDLMKLVMDADNETRGFALRGTTNWAAHIGKAVQNAILARWGQPSGAGEVVAWMWQHDETGRTGFVDCYQVENGWQAQNPRLKLVSQLYTTPQPTQAVPPAGREPTIQWPKERDVGRIGDMSPSNFLRVGLDSDHDAYVSVCGEDGIGSVEFCVPGAGGGKSSHTRMALIALMVAIEADNAEDPGRDWWARRMGGIKGAPHG